MATQTADAPVRATQTPCRDCGEMVRQGLVRCFNCGAFMDPEVEKRFLEMQKSPPPPILSSPDESDAATAAAGDEAFSADAGAGDEGGFTMGGAGDGVGLENAMPDDFGVEADIAPADPVPGVSVPSEAADEDDLLSVAMNDLGREREKELQRALTGFAGGVRTAGGFIIFCPYGCRIEVKDKHRGNVGKCPKCSAPFVVPVDPPKYRKKAAPQPAEGTAAAAPGAVGKYALWLEDQHLHVVEPEKLKLKADSLVKEFVERDLALSEKHLALIPLTGKGGLFGGGGAKKEDVRESAKEAAGRGDVPDKSDAGETLKIRAERLKELRVVQPAKGQSLFAGVAVFGAGRIAVQLPDLSDANNPAAGKPHYLSFGLTDFRRLSESLENLHGLGKLGAEEGVPLVDETFEHTCHYTDATIRALKALEFYKADPKVDLVVAGWQCGECGLTVSEDARKKEGLGGKAGKGMAKAKCPKCEKKMGDHPLHTRAELVEDAKMQSES